MGKPSIRHFNKYFKRHFWIFFSALILGCASQASIEERLVPPNSTKNFRLVDIEHALPDDPVQAVHQIGVYEAIYGSEASHPDPGAEEKLEDLRGAAIETMRASQRKAVEEKRWTDAATLARSLANLGIGVENTGDEPDFILEGAKAQLESGNDLAAFLGAARSHNLKALDYEDALLFLERAVRVKQRRTAAFFLGAIEAASAGRVAQELRYYAQGRDTPQDMIKGVATVMVNRGYRVERGRGYPEWALGSAFFVDASGLLITNYHVIASEVDPSYEGYSRMFIRLGDSSSPRIPAKVVGWDKAMDLALIRAELKPDYVFSVVDSVVPAIGDTVIAIGSPGGLEKTVTSGIVSALGRRFLQLGDVIQIDAAVNQGNSGGPVVDTSGRLVGIVFAGIEQFQGLNFAVPAERLASALPAMIRGGKAERPWLGLTLSEGPAGAEIIYVAPFTPAGEQMVREGSVIKSINGEEIHASQGALIPAWQDILFPLQPGELVSLELSDPDGKTSRHVLRTTARPSLPLAEAAKKDSKERMAAALYGLVLGSQQSRIYGVNYLVKKVVRGSVADTAGLSENDPVAIRGFRLFENDGYALLEITVKKRRMGYLETSMQLPALLDSPNTL